MALCGDPLSVCRAWGFLSCCSTSGTNSEGPLGHGQTLEVTLHLEGWPARKEVARDRCAAFSRGGWKGCRLIPEPRVG